jgi:hypothetical protein
VSKGAPVLLATTIFVLQEGGNYKQFHRGEAVPGLNEEQVDRLTKCGALGTSDDLEPEAVETDDGVERNGAGVPVSDEDADDADDEGVELPPKVASKPVLIQWLVDNAVDSEGNDYVADELEEQTKAQLWELIDATVE